jgi:alkylation response protein AidB-like acyl-CoA dehydrogenase
MAQIGNVRLSLSAQAVGTAMWVLDHLREVAKGRRVIYTRLIIFVWIITNEI